MQPFSRRGFLAAGAAGLSAAAMSGLRSASAGEDHSGYKSGTDRVQLGKNGLECSMLGIGTGMRGGSEPRALGTGGFTELLAHAVERGINYIDTADMYRMHVFIQIAMQAIGKPRGEYFIQTKTRAKTAEVAEADVNRFIREMGCRYLDTCLVHCMTSGDWTTTMRPVMDVLSAAKEQGKIKAKGVSCHTLDALKAAADSDWVDVILVRINHDGTKMDGTPEEVTPLIEKMHDRGVGVIGMKIYGEGNFKTYDARYTSLEYVLGLDTVDAFTIGFNSPDQIDETLDSIRKILA